MARQSLTVNVVTLKPFKDNMFKEFLEIDSDYLENEDYFREDTLELGFENEAERVSKELNKKFTKKWQSIKDSDDEDFMRLIEKFLGKASNVNTGGSQFILGNQTYVSDYELTPIFAEGSLDYDDEIVVVISYIG